MKELDKIRQCPKHGGSVMTESGKCSHCIQESQFPFIADSPVDNPIAKAIRDGKYKYDDAGNMIVTVTISGREK